MDLWRDVALDVDDPARRRLEVGERVPLAVTIWPDGTLNTASVAVLHPGEGIVLDLSTPPILRAYLVRGTTPEAAWC